MQRTIPAWRAAPLAWVALFACVAWQPAARAEPARPRVHTVAIDGMRFIPQNLEVKAGDTVVWRNKDPFPHTATTLSAGAGGPDSPPIGAGESWTFTAGKPGRYPYLCTLHRTMTGTLVVTPVHQ